MSKAIVIAAASALFFTAAPAVAQDARCPAPQAAGLDSRPGSGVLRHAPSQPAASRGPGFDGPRGSASDLTDRPPSDPTAACRPAFHGPHGSASDLADRPPSDPTASATTGYYRQRLGRQPDPAAAPSHVKVFSGNTGAELQGAPQATRRPGFDGPHGSATNLRDAPPSDPTASHLRQATLTSRKAGDDKHGDGRPAPRPTGGLTKSGAGTLENTGGETAPRARQQNNIRQLGTAHAPR